VTYPANPATVDRFAEILLLLTAVERRDKQAASFWINRPTTESSRVGIRVDRRHGDGCPSTKFMRGWTGGRYGWCRSSFAQLPKLVQFCTIVENKSTESSRLTSLRRLLGGASTWLTSKRGADIAHRGRRWSQSFSE
jgi:hypothetical protein